MASLNKCAFIGNVGKIESKCLPNGDAVVNFSLAVNESYKNKDGVKVEHTEWINAVAFRKLGEIMAQYVQKGASIYIEGKLRTRKWQDKDGQDRYTTEIIADGMQMLGSRQDSGEVRERESAPAKPAAPKPAGDFSDMDDDIPF